MKKKPLHKHDCSSCTFLGSIDFGAVRDYEGKTAPWTYWEYLIYLKHRFTKPKPKLRLEIDYYFCAPSGTVIGRISSEPSDYASWMLSQIQDIVKRNNFYAEEVGAYFFLKKENLLNECS